MLKEPEVAKEIKGVSIHQEEVFLVKPAALKLEIVSKVKKSKKGYLNNSKKGPRIIPLALG